jgi:hypothetical protein
VLAASAKPKARALAAVQLLPEKLGRLLAAQFSRLALHLQAVARLALLLVALPAAALLAQQEPGQQLRLGLLWLRPAL